MLQPIGISALRNAEFIQFFSQLLQTVSNGFGDQPVPAAFSTSRAKVEAVVADMNTLFKNDPASGLTAELQELDLTRDRLISSIVKICDAHLYYPDTEVAAAAALLSRNLSIYGSGIAEQGHNAETATINNILRDWTDKPELAGAATALNLGVWTAALAIANNDFNIKFLERAQQVAANNLPYTMKQKRSEAIALYNAFIAKINGFYEVSEGGAPWGGIVAAVGS